MRIERVAIERLLLDGIEVADPAAFGRSVAWELRRVLRQQDWAEPERGINISRADGGDIEWVPASGSGSLARTVAERIGGVIRRGAKR